MFIPLGLGGYLKKIPFGTLILTYFCILWSYSFFPESAAFEARFKSAEVTDASRAIEDLRETIVKDQFESCEDKDLSTCFYEVASVANEMSAETGRWPASAKKHAKYSELLKKENKIKSIVAQAHKDFGFFSLQTFSFMHLVRASFVHANIAHLVSNLLLLLLVGIWVEQRVKTLTLMLTFLGASFIGLTLQVFVSPEAAILGASAGVYGILGLFFVLFFRRDMNYLFTVFPVYFRRLTLPVLWTFPFLFLTGEIAAFFAGQISEIGHAAHAGGAMIGFAVGFWVRRKDGLPEDMAFVEETKLLKSVHLEEKSESTWKAMRQLMGWNPQNWTGLRSFLNRCRKNEVDLSTSKDRAWLEKRVALYCLTLGRKNSQENLQAFVKEIPEELSLSRCFSRITNTKVLRIADAAANGGEFLWAGRLYRAALLNETQKLRRLHIKAALEKIEDLEKTDQNLSNQRIAV